MPENMTPVQQAAYAEAQARIEACRKSGESTLCLSRLDLGEIPPEIGQLT